MFWLKNIQILNVNSQIQINMKNFKLIVTSCSFLISFYTFSQTISRDFQSEDGLYGTITFTAEPSSSRSINVDCQNISIKGIRTSQGHYSGSDLINYGVTFPINNAKGHFVANGTAAVYINQFARNGQFNGNRFVYHNISNTYSVNFNENVKELIRETNKTENRDVWKETGRVVTDQVNIRAVNVSDRYGINYAIRKLVKEKENKEQYDNLISQANNAQTDQQKLDILTKARQYASNNQKTQLENQISNVQNKIKQEKQERLAQNQQNSQSQQTNSNDDFWNGNGSNQRSSNTTGTVAKSSSSSETAGQKALREYNEWSKEQDRQRAATLGSYSSNVGTQISNNYAQGNYQQAATQATVVAIDAFSSGDTGTGITATSSGVISLLADGAQRRREAQARQAAREAEEERLNQIKRDRERAERAQKRAIANTRSSYFNNLPNKKIPINYHDTKAYFIFVLKNSNESLSFARVTLNRNKEQQLPYKIDILNKLKKKVSFTDAYIQGPFESQKSQNQVYNMLSSRVKSSLLKLNQDINMEVGAAIQTDSNTDFWGNTKQSTVKKKTTTIKKDFWN